MQEQGHIDQAELVYSAEMRYRGLSYEIDTVLDPAHVASGDAQAVADAFHAMHRRLYGHADAHAPVPLIRLRVVISGHIATTRFPPPHPRAGPPQPESSLPGLSPP